MDPLILSGAAVIDGTGAEPVRGRSVVVEVGRVTAVVDDARAPRGARVDLDGATLLPGLINAHVHLCMGAEADPVGAMKGETLAATTIRALVRARETAAAGVTTVRDLGGREYCELAVRQAIRDGLVEGPRILAAGRPLILGGVTVPSELGLEGHSDADILAHAITDALLGAAAAPVASKCWSGACCAAL